MSSKTHLKLSHLKNYTKSDTLIIFDKLQDFPEIDTSTLKLFKIDEHIDVIYRGDKK